ncbi:MAG: phytanoyl-CoA dioxygenase family protein [Actinomycetota bacterium]
MTFDVARFGDRDYWLELNPELTISDIPSRGAGSAARSLAAGEVDAQAGQFPTTGWMEFGDLLDPDRCRLLATALDRLVDAGIPTPFLYVYDEVWQLFLEAQEMLSGVLGEHYLVGGDIWVWHVSPESNTAGWAPHRDDNLGDGWLDDGRPAMITIWVALTEATIDNGCMYILPTDRDTNVPDNLKVREIDRYDLPGIRAMPATPGSIMAWSTRLLHWGGKASSTAEHARMSLAIYVQRADADPYHDDMLDPTGSVPLHYRLGVISRALRIYEDSRMAGTAVSDAVLEFADEQRERLEAWLAMVEQLEASGRTLA